MRIYILIYIKKLKKRENNFSLFTSVVLIYIYIYTNLSLLPGLWYCILFDRIRRVYLIFHSFSIQIWIIKVKINWIKITFCFICAKIWINKEQNFYRIQVQEESTDSNKKCHSPGDSNKKYVTVLVFRSKNVTVLVIRTKNVTVLVFTQSKLLRSGIACNCRTIISLQ